MTCMVENAYCAPFDINFQTTDITRTKLFMPFNCPRELTWYNLYRQHGMHRTVCFSLLLPIESAFCPVCTYQNCIIEQAKWRINAILLFPSSRWRWEQTEEAPSDLLKSVVKGNVTIFPSVLCCWKYEKGLLWSVLYEVYSIMHT